MSVHQVAAFPHSPMEKAQSLSRSPGSRPVIVLFPSDKTLQMRPIELFARHHIVDAGARVHHDARSGVRGNKKSILFMLESHVFDRLGFCSCRNQSCQEKFHIQQILLCYSHAEMIFHHAKTIRTFLGFRWRCFHSMIAVVTEPAGQQDVVEIRWAPCPDFKDVVSANQQNAVKICWAMLLQFRKCCVVETSRALLPQFLETLLSQFSELLLL